MKFSRHLLRAFAAIAAISAFVATSACSGGEEDNSSDEPFHILNSTGVTGLLAPTAEAVTRGIEAAIKSLNADGGLHGRQIELTTMDNQSDPTRGVSNIQAAINGNEKPDLVITGVSSNEALAVAPLLGRTKTIGIGPASSADLNDPEKYPYFFSQGPLQRDTLRAAASFLAEQGDVRRVALVAPDDGLGDAVGDELEGAFDRVGIETSDHRFKADAVDYTAAFQQALATDPDWIYMEGSGTGVPHLLTSRVKAGAEDVKTIIGVNASAQPILDLTEGTNQLDNVSVLMLPTQAFVEPADRSDLFNEFFDRLKAQGPIETALATYGAGWESVMIWAEAVKSVDGQVTAENVREALIHPPEVDRLMYQETYSPDSNFVVGAPGDYTIAEVTSMTDGMFVLK